ncbi:MAG TPA: ABC transporter permease [Ignavibacteriaceae bacterium]|nr:ABC transporter permease [Ignavibacteriaceae bacterium]
MIKSYLKIAMRSLFKNKLYSFVNIAGLAIGMSACILILLWVTDELSYNKFNKNIDSIFVIPQTQHYQTVGDFTVMPTPIPLAPALKEEIPEIKYATRYASYLGKRKITFEEKTFNQQVNFADPDFFKIFSFDFIEGDKENALRDKSSIIITQEMAEKFFDGKDPVGKIIKMDDKFDMVVSGVVYNTPDNSDIKFDMLVPIALLKDIGYNMNNWGQNMLHTYVMLNNPERSGEVTKKIEGRLKKEIKASTAGKMFLYPLTKLHLYSISGKGGRIETVIIFSIIAFFILIIACINFMNLATARSAKRATEVGIKKAVGATRPQIAKQFFGESLLYTFISLAFAILLVEVLLPLFNDLSGKELALKQVNGDTMLLILIVTLVTGILSGIYPALFLSGFNPVEVLKSKLPGKTSKFSLRQILVVIQFSISIILIIGTIIVYLQMNFILNKNLGLDKDNIIYINLSDQLQRDTESLKTELLRNTNIKSATVSTHLPISVYSNGGGWKWEGKDPEQDELVSSMGADLDFLKTYDIKLKEGRYYSKEFPADDTLSLVINETFAKLMGFDNPVGKILSAGESFHRTIIGVVKDFNFLQLQRDIGPLIIWPDPTPRILSIKLNNADIGNTLNFIKSTCKEFDSRFVFDYEFLDKTYENIYTSQKRLGQIFNSFAILAIIISCLGLLGLAAYVAELKTKEIGIRKVLGATTAGITYTLSKQFIFWVLLANAVAWPVAYYFMNNWLQDFAYRIDMPYWVFISAALVAILIAVITVSSQAIKAANSDPVKSLRYE